MDIQRFAVLPVALTAGLAVGVSVLAMVPSTAQPAAASCERLASLSLPQAKIDTAEAVPAGDFTLRARTTGGNPQVFRGLPAFCRVAATLKPSADSDIKVEVWLPAIWNGKFQAVGNGGWAGTISYGALADGVRRGYATASTDTGHTGDGGEWVPGHPERVVDFGWRAVREMTLKSKAVIAAHYGNAPRLSYWNGCSLGGRQGLHEAIRFPDDFDGMVAGAPANPRAHNNAWQLSVMQTIAKNSGGILDSKLPMIHRATLAACDAGDGAKDGLIENPKACKFDPSVLVCKGADGPDCLTPAQVETVRIMTTPGKLASGKEYWPGLTPGSELNWPTLTAPGATPYAEDHFKYIVYNDPKWDWRTFKLDEAITAAERAGKDVDVMDVDLSKFTARGGKMIMYHGWNDHRVAPGGTIRYYTAVREKMGAEKADASVRLFMAPGMNHCAGGEGPNSFDALTALEQWVENGRAPEQLVATHSTNGRVDRSRPLCRFPQVARYKGTGSVDEAANFACVAP